MNCGELVAAYFDIKIDEQIPSSNLHKQYLLQEKLFQHAEEIEEKEHNAIVLCKAGRRSFHVGVLLNIDSHWFVLHTHEKAGMSHIVPLDRLPVSGYIVKSFLRIKQ